MFALLCRVNYDGNCELVRARQTVASSVSLISRWRAIFEPNDPNSRQLITHGAFKCKIFAKEDPTQKREGDSTLRSSITDANKLCCVSSWDLSHGIEIYGRNFVDAISFHSENWIIETFERKNKTHVETLEKIKKNKI